MPRCRSWSAWGPKHPHPGLAPRTVRDYRAVFIRAVREALDDHVTNWAAALAYYPFLAIPAPLLVAVGAFSLFAWSTRCLEHRRAPLGSYPSRGREPGARNCRWGLPQQRAAAGVTMLVVGFVLAPLLSGADPEDVMWALNEAYEREETRGFIVKRRLTGLVMVVLLLLAFALAFGLLVLGLHLSGWIGSAVGAQHSCSGSGGRPSGRFRRSASCSPSR